MSQSDLARPQEQASSPPGAPDRGSDPPDWTLSQIFGEEPREGADSQYDEQSYITALAFDSTGSHLGVGFRCGQVVILREASPPLYRMYTDFQSHKSSFDVLTSMEIGERINMVRWYPFPQYETRRLLTTNDKTIKLFRISDHSPVARSPTVSVKLEQQYEGSQTLDIHSIDFNSDGETFISADQLRINLWNLSTPTKPITSMEVRQGGRYDDSPAAITSAALHPINCSLLLYGTSLGAVLPMDLRCAPSSKAPMPRYSCDKQTTSARFEELVSVVSDARFSPCGRYVASRDYASVRVWDVRKTEMPLSVTRFSEYLADLANLYCSEAIFDRFDLTWGPNSKKIITGGYDNTLHVIDFLSGRRSTIRAARTSGMVCLTVAGLARGEGGDEAPDDHGQDFEDDGIARMAKYGDDTSDEDDESRDLIFRSGRKINHKHKILRSAWHPKNSIVAFGTQGFGNIYKGTGEGL